MNGNKINALLVCCVFLMCISNSGCTTSTAQNTPTVTPQTSAPNYKLSGHVENGVRIVEVQAFRYGYNPDPIVVKKGTKVRLLLTSKDTTHGFAIADLNIDLKIPPGKVTSFEFVPKNAGTYTIHCTEFCGLGHFNMRGTLVVLN